MSVVVPMTTEIREGECEVAFPKPPWLKQVSVVNVLGIAGVDNAKIERVVVNARYTYWMSSQPIPGGVAFENFELNERFYPGQQFVFGMTRKTVAELGVTSTNPVTFCPGQ